MKCESPCIDTGCEGVVLAHPTGSQFVREAGRALDEAGLLFRFYTTICFRERGCARWLPPGFKKEFARRMFDCITPDRIRVHPWRETGRLFAGKLGFSHSFQKQYGVGVGHVYRSLDRHVAQEIEKKDIGGRVRAVYAYEDGALESFISAKKIGAKAFYDLPIGHWKELRRICEEERDMEPCWAGTMESLEDEQEKLDNKDREIELSSEIVVASTFTKETLRMSGVEENKIKVIPYGAGSVWEERKSLPKRGRKEKLRILYVGSLTQRKGVSYLFSAVRKMGASVELTVVGRKTGESRLLDSVLKEHHYVPSVSHSEVLGIMRKNDVLVFPSLFEGFGQVILEAMSQGMAVVTTPNTAGRDIIENGRDGVIVPIRSVEAICEWLEKFYENSDCLRFMQEAALEKAGLLGWNCYRSQIASWVKENIAK